MFLHKIYFGIHFTVAVWRLTLELKPVDNEDVDNEEVNATSLDKMGANFFIDKTFYQW